MNAEGELLAEQLVVPAEGHGEGDFLLCLLLALFFFPFRFVSALYQPSVEVRHPRHKHENGTAQEGNRFVLLLLLLLLTGRLMAIGKDILKRPSMPRTERCSIQIEIT